MSTQPILAQREAIEDLILRAVNPLRLRIFTLEAAVAELQSKLGIENNPIEIEGKN